MNRVLNILLLWAVMMYVSTMASHAQTERYAKHSVLSEGKWVKIRVSEAGVYQITSAQVKSMGFSSIDKIRLFGYNMPVLPEARIEDISDDLTEIPLWRETADKVLFYSKGTTEWKLTRGMTSEYKHKNNPYSKYIYYFVTEGKTVSASDTGSPRPFEKKEETGTTELKAFTDHSIIESDQYSFINAGRTFFESYNFANGQNKNYTLKTPGIAGDDVTITVAFGAAGNSASTLTTSINNETLATMSFNSLVEYQYADVRSKTSTWRNTSRTESTNIQLKHTRSNGVDGHLDYIRATYTRALSLRGEKYLAFSPDKAGKYAATISNATPDTRVWKVTSPSTTCEQAGKLDGNNYNVGISSTIKDEYVAVNTKSDFPQVEVVGKIANQDLHAMDSIDMVIIVPANGKLIAEAQRLADAHYVHDRTRCAVVRADEVYNEFSSGTPDATAYRRLMKMLYDKASSSADAPKNLLLFGSCYWDNRFVTTGMSSKSQDDYLLCYESDNGWSHTDSYVMEEYFTLLEDGKGIKPLKETLDCGVGRLPVTTVTEAAAVVNKLIRYISNEDAGAWKNTICLMADDGNGNLHMNDVKNLYNDVSPLFPDFSYKRILWDAHTLVQTSTGSSYPTVYAEINKTMRDGALIMDYTGHGAAYCLSHEQVLKTKDFKAWDSPRLPLWITAACDVCPFDMNTENLAVEAVLNTKGAAMGFIGTARTVYSSQNLALNRRLLPLLLKKAEDGGRYSIGEALAAAKNGVIANMSQYSKTDSINKVHFVLMGDPAITLQTPEYKVVIDKMSSKDADVKRISAGETITVTGHIEDEHGKVVEDYNGILSPTVFDNIEHIVCNNNDGSASKPFEYDDRTRVLFTGADSIRNGHFTFSFPVPLDINYSNDSGLMSLYAINIEKNKESNGQYVDFAVGGTTDDISTDSIGPAIKMYLNYPEFRDGGITDEQPTLFVQLRDSDGINTTGSGLGHDITVMIDNKESLTFTLNSYFVQTIGDYTSGTIEYKLSGLPTGQHTLTLRAFDVLNNMGEETLRFTSIDGMVKTYEVFDMAGRKLHNSETNIMLPGVYVFRVLYLTPEGEEVGIAKKKFVVTGKETKVNIITY